MFKIISPDGRMDRGEFVLCMLMHPSFTTRNSRSVKIFLYILGGIIPLIKEQGLQHANVAKPFKLL